MDLNDAYKVLGVSENATQREIEQEYRDLAAVWHPDRHTGNSRLQQKALETMKELNAARDCILYHLRQTRIKDKVPLSEKDPDRRILCSDAKCNGVIGSDGRCRTCGKTQNQGETTAKSEAKLAETVCFRCGMRNRFDSLAPKSDIRCGKCHSYLFHRQRENQSKRDDPEEDDNQSFDPSTRILCSDGNCIGVINKKGFCKVCGKPYKPNHIGHDSDYYLSAIELWDSGTASFHNPLEAIEFLNRAIFLNPRKEEAYSKRGLAYGQLKKYRQSINDHSAAIHLNPRNSTNYVNRGQNHVAIGEYQKGLQDFNAVIQLTPNDPAGYILRAAAYWALGKYKEWSEDYTRLINMDPHNAVYYYCRGWGYGRLDHHQRAIEDLSKAILLDPTRIEPYISRGFSYKAIRDYKKMCEDFRKAAELGDSTPLRATLEEGLCQG